ncbi:exodeoxyribonuclease V subunit gamma [Nocardioides sp. Kera G14]|uniref:exodeoxyribonuclease V subunit gamma n=1 Tax=Nocardioides sp. Kera G14 TaxID=2884264 RepID=UPI001D12BAB3|nr:exodeoxyribonuclease V subunit gamma [Nocardioides sp. Kera G14]UDY23308.1 exodeoxyribonuclease V subunit gamma [Nocardioides sp. Kera G14]
MVLHLHRAARSDLLVAGLAELLAVPGEDPFATEVVVVPARGVERWLSQKLSDRLGVCAGVDFRTAPSLIAEILGTGDEDAWAPERLTWPLMSVIDATLGESWASPLARHLAQPGRRLALARRLARLFSSYAGQRPSLVADWTAGGSSDGLGGVVPEDLAWQPELWRRLVASVPVMAPHLRQAAVVAHLQDGPAGDLPSRVSLFGHTRLSASEIELLGALGEHREVHLWLPHPSAPLWAALDDLGGPVVRAEDRSHEHVGHPLLASLGRDVRELQRSLSRVELVDEPVAAGVEAPPTLLGWLQSDLRANVVEVTSDRVVATGDRSVQLHAAHGPARQVEVLREVVLGLLADDPTLEPRDVLVMCPDIETYAPLLEASFGLADVVGPEGHPAHKLRVRLADRSPESTNPLLGIASTLLDLAGGRAGVGEVLDLAHLEPVWRRFGLRDDDLEQLATWAAETGIRWGFDAAHREPFGLGDYAANTWEFGLDRLLTGVALSDDAGAWLDATLPLDDVGSGSIELAGRLTELVHRLRDVTDRLVGEHPLGHWLDALVEGVDALTSVKGDDGWQYGQLVRELGRIRAAADGVDAGTLGIADVRALLADRLAGRPTRANFRTGSLTVATLVPMRSVPHRVVAVLGLDDGVFPRARAVDGDDLLARTPMTGERDLRTEDRQLLLDAILAAKDTLVVTWTGADVYSGQPRPPAVPLGELIDALDLTATAPDGRRVSEVVTARHPLQPFDARNLTPGALVPGQPFTFDRSALAGARSALQERTPVPPLLDAPLPVAGDRDVGLEELLAFWKSPVRGFFRQSLDLALPRDEESLDDGLPVEVDQLVQWGAGDRILGDLLRGLHPDQARQREFRRGVVPPKWLGWRLLDEVVAKAKPIGAEGLRLRGSTPSRTVDIDVDLGGGRRLRGTVGDLFGDRMVTVHYSRLGASHRLQSWIRLLALAATDEDRAWSALTLGRAGGARGAAFSLSQLGPLDHTARAVLRDLVSLREEGLAMPLPLPLKTSLTYARHRRTGMDHDGALEKAGWDWRDGKFPGEQSAAEHARAWGARAPLPEPDRFADLALRLWSPLLVAEQGSW